MPFTPSHAIVALPLLRTPLVPAALAIGAMTPDLPLFTRGLGLGYLFTHSVVNVGFTALIALVLLLLWRVVLRPGLVALAPDALARRLPETWSQSGRAIARDALRGPGGRGGPWLLAASLVIGVLSHIGWDLFTHERRWGVEALPALQQMWGPMPGYRWLQHGSSVVGLVVIAGFMLRWVRQRPARQLPHRSPVWLRWLWMLALPAVLGGAWLLGLATSGPDITVQQLAYRTLPAASGLWGALTFVLCLLLVTMRRETGVTDASITGTPTVPPRTRPR